MPIRTRGALAEGRHYLRTNDQIVEQYRNILIHGHAVNIVGEGLGVDEE